MLSIYYEIIKFWEANVTNLCILFISQTEILHEEHMEKFKGKQTCVDNFIACLIYHFLFYAEKNK
jgi:hypothetical protein